MKLRYILRTKIATDILTKLNLSQKFTRLQNFLQMGISLTYDDELLECLFHQGRLLDVCLNDIQMSYSKGFLIIFYIEYTEHCQVS